MPELDTVLAAPNELAQIEAHVDAWNALRGPELCPLSLAELDSQEPGPTGGALALFSSLRGFARLVGVARADTWAEHRSLFHCPITEQSCNAFGVPGDVELPGRASFSFILSVILKCSQ